MCGYVLACAEVDTGSLRNREAQLQRSRVASKDSFFPRSDAHNLTVDKSAAIAFFFREDRGLYLNTSILQREIVRYSDHFFT